MGKKKKLFGIISLSLVLLLIVNLVGWSTYLFLHDAVTDGLQYAGIDNPYLQNVIIISIGLFLLIVVGGFTLNKAVNKILK